MIKIIRLFIGVTLSSLGIATVANSTLGTFAINGSIQALSNWTGLTFGITNLIAEMAMISYATYKGEGLGWTAIANALGGSVLISFFMNVLPKTPLLVLGLFILPIAWAMMGSVGWGDTGSNILMTALMKTTGKDIVTIRTIEETFFLIIGFLGARHSITIFSVFLTLFTPVLLKWEYGLMGYKPIEVEQQYLSFKRLVGKNTH